MCIVNDFLGNKRCKCDVVMLRILWNDDDYYLRLESKMFFVSFSVINVIDFLMFYLDIIF